MKKLAIFLACVLCVLVVLTGGLIAFFVIGDSNLNSTQSDIFASEHSEAVFSSSYYENISITPEYFEEIEEINYQVYIQERLVRNFETFEDAFEYAYNHERASILDSSTRQWVWDNFPIFSVVADGIFVEFEEFHQAVTYARDHRNATVVHRPNQATVWSNAQPLRNSVRLDVRNILQFPALPRGCEVTALAILLNHAGIDVDKMTLANQVKRNPIEREVVNGVIYAGHPNYGFVGDMFNSANHGLGVYHGPIFDLMQQYLPNASINLTGSNFEDLLFFLNRGIPVWVITNATHNVLRPEDFNTWRTPQGDIEITYWLHAVVISGYDENYIYFSDPLADRPIGRTHAPREEFIAAWEQMGRQAIAYAF